MSESVNVNATTKKLNLKFKTREELMAMKNSDLILHLENLFSIITGLSEELVKLLQEREVLIDGVDVRNIFIEQLLKLQSKEIEPSFKKNDFYSDYVEDEYDSESDEIS